MAYKWLTLNKNFDRSLRISKIRYDTSINCPLVTDGFFSELPNINTDGKSWNEPSGATWGYATENRFSPWSSRDWFSNHYYGFTDVRWSSQTHTTLVSGTTYEFVCPLTLYYSGIQHPDNENIDLYLSKLTVYVEIPFEINPENMSFSYTGGTSALTITCDGGWTASTNDSWLTLSSTSGTGDSTITITAAANSGIQRNGVVSVTDGSNTLTCTISQDKHPVLVKSDNIYFEDTRVNKMYLNGSLIYRNLIPSVVFDIDTTEVEMEYTGGTFTVEITANRPWSLTTPEWISASSVSGIESSTVTFTVGENSGSTARVGNISVTCNNVTKQINVTQSAETHVQYVSAVYKQDGTASSLMTIDTGFKATLDTVMRINYIGRGIENGDTLMGYSQNMPNCGGDDRDYRYFSVGNWVYKDFNTIRNYASVSGGNYKNGVEYDISFYNNYLYDNINSTIFVTGDTQTYIGSPDATIHVDIGSVKLKEFKITQGGVVVFDGKAAVLNGVVGLYDSVSGQMFTCPNTTMIYDE